VPNLQVNNVAVKGLLFRIGFRLMEWSRGADHFPVPNDRKGGHSPAVAFNLMNDCYVEAEGLLSVLSVPGMGILKTF
jgi:hypothetical protein